MICLARIPKRRAAGMNGKTRGLILLLASIALFLGSVAMCLALLGPHDGHHAVRRG